MIALIAPITFILSYKKDSSSGVVTTPPVVTVPGDSVIAPDGFDFSTTRTVSFSINLQSNNNEPISGVPVSIYAGDPATSTPVITTMSNSQGILQGAINLPAHVDTLIIDAKYVGLMRNAKAGIVNNTVSGTIGGSSGFGGNISPNNYVGKLMGNMRVLTHLAL